MEKEKPIGTYRTVERKYFDGTVLFYVQQFKYYGGSYIIKDWFDVVAFDNLKMAKEYIDNNRAKEVVSQTVV